MKVPLTRPIPGAVVARALLASLAAAIIAGCGDDSSDATGPRDDEPLYPDVAGTYTLSGTVDDTPEAAFTGTLVLEQADRDHPELTGQVLIVGNEFFDGLSVHGPVTAMISETGTLAFSAGNGETTWSFEGMVLGGQLSGRYTLSDAQGSFSGTWQATRAAGIGAIAVTTTTTGDDPDPDGYTLSVDGGTPQAIGINATLTIPNLSVGDHSVVLSGVASNCSVDGGASRTGTVTVAATAQVAFAVTCTRATGTVEVTTSTTGENVDPDGYTVAVDTAASQPIEANDTLAIADVAAGTHTVLLSGVAPNCTITDNPRSITVTAGGTTQVAFGVTCVATNAGLRPDLRTVVPRGLRLEVTDQEREILRFTNAIANTGRGPWHVKPRFPQDTTGTQDAIQQVFDAEGNVVEERLVSQYEYHPTHEHWHIEDVALYEVRSGSLTGPIVGDASRKTTFCLIDWEELAGHADPAGRTYTECNADAQGISVGWVDVYGWWLPGQDLDITGAPEGRYYLISTVDPEGKFIEENRANNRAWTSFDVLRDPSGRPSIRVVDHSPCTGGLCG